MLGDDLPKTSFVIAFALRNENETLWEDYEVSGLSKQLFTISNNEVVPVNAPTEELQAQQADETTQAIHSITWDKSSFIGESIGRYWKGRPAKYTKFFMINGNSYDVKSNGGFLALQRNVRIVRLHVAVTALDFAGV